MPDFRGRAAGFDGAAGVAVDGAFELAANRDGEFDQGASFRIERASFGGGVAESVVGCEDFREIFLEFEIAAGEFSGRRRFGFAHGSRVADSLAAGKWFGQLMASFATNLVSNLVSQRQVVTMSFKLLVGEL